MRKVLYLFLVITILEYSSNLKFATGKVIRSKPNKNVQITRSIELVNDLQHLAVDRFSGKIFIGGRNRLFELTPDLDLINTVNIAPQNGFIDDINTNINTVLLIDYDSNRLITCASLHGSCSTRHLGDINYEQDIKNFIVADSEVAPCVAFIAPGPSSANVMYVGVTNVGNYNEHYNIPAVSSRSLFQDQTFTISASHQTTSMPVPFGSNVPKSNPTNFTYGFSSAGFSYFLANQLESRFSIVKRDYTAKLIRVCQNDPHYYSLTEMPIDCIGNGIKYNLVQAAYLGKAGIDLANELGITAQDDVLYAVFSTGKDNIPSKNSALCIYPLKDVRRKFMENIQSSFNDKSTTSSAFFPSAKLEITEDFCGSETNHPIEGTFPVTAAPVLTFKQRLTAVAATKTRNGKSTEAYVGTADGYVTKVLIKSKSLATEYPDIKIYDNSPIKADMQFDVEEKNLYVMTKNRVAKVKISDCSDDGDCLETNNDLKSVQPVITDFSPKVGPKSGGTVISITGNNLQSSNLLTANIDGVQCVILSVNENQAVCRTNPSSVKRYGKLQLVFKNVIRDTRQFYQFEEDPTITWVTSGLNGKKPKGIPSGGIKVFVAGTNFKVIQKPQLFVHYGERTFFSDCTTLNNEQMECISPVFDVDSSQLSDDSVKLDYGFIMDDVTSVHNLVANGLPMFKLCPNPWFESFSPNVKEIKDDYLVINGNHLDCACEEYDVLILIGSSLCNVTAISRFQVICKPESSLYNVNENQKITVKFGETLTSDLGFVKFVPKHNDGGISGNIEVNIPTTETPVVPLKKSSSRYYKFIIFGVIALILFLAGSTIYLCMRVKRERALTRVLKAAGFASFEEGRPDSINPDLSLDEQAELLPYDRKYEFPRDKLKLGKKLGSGAFGIVMQGVAQGIVPYEDETVVAVKMVKRMSNDEVMKALISELKIMVHLGQHLNVVNLLGAVTKDIAQCNVMVIVEYCDYGNLQNFLIKNRKYFIDQIDRDTGMIDSSINIPNTEFANNESSQQYPQHNYVNESRQENSGMLVVNSAYCGTKGVYSGNSTGMNTGGTEATVLLRDNYTSDNRVTSNNPPTDAEPHMVTTNDLLCWSFQITRGMQYLTSRKVVHGDLAARNILLCSDNVVKICDFGLARSLYKTDIYKKEGEDPLPVKWLALESISDHVFSTKTDVWSFGVVLWELFSLGRSPYTGMSADHNLYSLLKNGYRMDKPSYATKEIYDVMLSCWRVNPESRPLFEELETSISQFLENDMAEHYVNLNEPYLEANVNNYRHGKTDYIALMGAPEFRAPMTPTYVNASDIIDVNNIEKDTEEQENNLEENKEEEEIPMTQYTK